MNIFIKLALVSLLLITESCDSTKSTASNESSNSTEEAKTIQKDYTKEGYSIGTVLHLKDSKCNYIIVDEKTGAKFDPINIDDEKFASFKNDKTLIYYKFQGLRMMNRCLEAQPISLMEIKKRED